MIVGIVSDVIYGYISGLAIFTKRLIEQLSNNVEKVIVLTSDDKQRIEERGNVKIYYFKGFTLKRFKEGSLGIYPLNTIKDILQQEKVSVVHCQLASPMGAVTVYYSRKFNIPVIFTSHIQPENIMKNFNWKSQGVKSFFYKYATWIYNFCDHITCPSRLAKKELQEYGIDSNARLSIISNGIDANQFIPKNIASDPVILFIGRIMPEKCIATLIHASSIVKKRYPEYKFVIGGGGYALDELKSLAKTVNPDIIFTDKLTDTEIIDYFQRCYVFVLPSESELQGIALLEAMSCGKPTIASDSEYSAARDLANFTFRHNDYNDLAEKIIYLIENKNLVEELSRRNREEIINNHDYSIITRLFIDLYERSIQEKAMELSLSQVPEK